MECLESVFTQTYPNCEIIVVDDGSTDSSLTLLKQLGNRIRLHTGPNQGACAARNKGLDIAKGKYVKFFDVDDIMMPGAITTQVEAMEKLDTHHIIFGNLLDLDTKKTVFDNIRTTADTDRDQMIYQTFCHDIITGCPLHHRQFLIDHHLRFDERLLRGQEWDLHLAIAIAGGVFVYQPEVIYHYRSHDNPDRISQIQKNPQIKLENRWLKLSGGCQKVFDAYQGKSIYPPTKAKIRKRLGKTEADFSKLGLKDKVQAVRQLRKQIDSPLMMFLRGIRYIPRRYFSKNPTQ